MNKIITDALKHRSDMAAAILALGVLNDTLELTNAADKLLNQTPPSGTLAQEG